MSLGCRRIMVDTRHHQAGDYPWKRKCNGLLSQPFPALDLPATNRQAGCLAGSARWKSGWHRPGPRSRPHRCFAIKVFVEEMGARLRRGHAARSAISTRSTGIATICWCSTRRLAATVEEQIVGTYRLLRQEVAERHDGFYSQSEFDVSDLAARNPGKRFLELGRSCVLPRIPHPAHAGSAVAGQLGLCA
jgi:hypothetical protein